jgi:hypothetical protein
MNKLRKSVGLLFPCILLGAEMVGFTPDEDKLRLDARKQVSESLAIQFATLDPTRDIKRLERLVNLVAKRNPSILSTGIRKESGLLVFKSAQHDQLWQGFAGNKSTPSHVLVPLLQKGKLWGNVELRFDALKSDSFFGFVEKGIFKLVVFCLLIGFFVYLVFMLTGTR